MLNFILTANWFRKIMVFLLSVCALISSLFGLGYTREVSYDNDVANALFSVYGTDSCGREVREVTDMDNNKYVGIFYFLWLGYTTPDSPVYDITKITQEGGLDKLLDINDNTYQFGAYYYWGEPLYGYYNSADRWVVMKHMKLLTSAGVDFIALDTTNAATYDSVVQTLIDVILDLQAQGFNPPKIVYYTNTNSAETVRHIYDTMYSVPEYDSVWFKLGGKPMIVADRDQLGAEGADDLCDYFYVKDKNWPNTRNNKWDSFRWMNWVRPQLVWGDKYLKNGVISVSVAQHPDGKMSASLTDRTKNWGRGYTSKNGFNDARLALSGANFQEQWDYAVSQNVDMVFVTGWNEWVAGRYNDGSDHIMFCDTASMEFSRDCEMMRGGYGDNFYMQLAENIRTFKGVALDADADTTAKSKSIDIFGDLSQWDGLTTFRCYTGDVFPRDCVGGFNSLHYFDDSGRNDIASVAVTYDDENIYIKVGTKNPVTAYQAGDKTWMNLLLGYKGYTGEKLADYGFVINRSNANGLASLENFTSDGTFASVGSVKISVGERCVQCEIPRASLGLSGGAFTLYVKACDHVGYDKGGAFDDTEFYVSGDSAPMGRMSYSVSGR